MVIPPKIKHRSNTWSSNHPSSYVPRRTKSKNSTDVCISRFTAALFTVESIDGLMDKQHAVINTMKYYSDLRNSDTCYNNTWILKMLRHYDKWSEPVISLILFVTKGQTMHDSTYMGYRIHSHRVQKTSKTQKIEWQLPGVGDGGMGVWSMKVDF